MKISTIKQDFCFFFTLYKGSNFFFKSTRKCGSFCLAVFKHHLYVISLRLASYFSLLVKIWFLFFLQGITVQQSLDIMEVAIIRVKFFVCFLNPQYNEPKPPLKFHFSNSSLSLSLTPFSVSLAWGLLS